MELQSLLMVGIAWIGYMEGVWTSLRKNARGVFAMEVELQGVPCFANGRWFCVLAGFRTQRLVFLAQGDVWNLSQMFAKVGSNRCARSVNFDKFLGYEANWEVTKSRPVHASFNYALGKPCPTFVDMVCSIRSCSRLKDSIWHKARFWQKWQSYLLLFLD